MKTKNDHKTTEQSGSAFTGHHRALDAAKNEKLKEETRQDKLDPQNANNPARRNHKTDVSQKKTGGGKQSSPGD
jgi:inhibitor of KinA sporulation pathway (predicted exonuclease)